MGGLLGTSARGKTARVAVAAVTALVIAGLVLFGVARLGGLGGTPLAALGGRPQTPSGPIVTGGPLVAAAHSRPLVTPDPATRAAEEAIAGPTAPPTSLVIPSLGVNAVVEEVGVNPDGSMAVPSQPDRVAWYRLGVAPGDPGDALIDGHLDWYGQPCTVFCHLANLRPGDQVRIIRADGSELTFMVDFKRTYPWNARTDSLVVTTGAPSISLVTCAGTWDQQRQTYLNRLVVHATLALSSPTVTPGDEGG